MPKIRPITDLRTINVIFELCHAKHEPGFITKNGHIDLVVMSIKTFEEMIETPCIDTAINEAKREYANNDVLLDTREVLSSLRRKHFNENDQS